MIIDRHTFLVFAMSLAVQIKRLSATMNFSSQVIELRQYTLRRDRRDDLIALFERHFIESQEAVGAHVLGTFRDLDDPDRFVWIRGFDDFESRAGALEAFYGGGVWKEHRTDANATMVDSDNVLLLRPATPASALPASAGESADSGIVRPSIHSLRGVDGAAFDGFFQSSLRPRILESGGTVLARYITEQGPNRFPALPIRGPDTVFVWIARFRDAQAERDFTQRLNRQSGWRDDAPSALLPALMIRPEVLRLEPTARSILR